MTWGRRYLRNLRVYIGHARPWGKQGLNEHVWAWGRSCALQPAFRVASWGCLGAGREWTSLPVISGCFSVHQQLLGMSSPCRRKVPYSLSKCIRPSILATADCLLLLSATLNLFPLLFFSSKFKPSPLLSSAFSCTPLSTISLSAGVSSFSNKHTHVLPTRKKSQSKMTFSVLLTCECLSSSIQPSQTWWSPTTHDAKVHRTICNPMSTSSQPSPP